MRLSTINSSDITSDFYPRQQLLAQGWTQPLLNELRGTSDSQPELPEQSAQEHVRQLQHSMHFRLNRLRYCPVCQRGYTCAGFARPRLTCSPECQVRYRQLRKDAQRFPNARWYSSEK